MIIIAVVILLLGCWIFNITCGSKKKVDTSNLSEYTNRVGSLVDASNALAQTWASIQGNLVQLIATPESLNDQLKAVEDQCKELQDQAKSLEVPEAVKDVNYALLMCFEGVTVQSRITAPIWSTRYRRPTCRYIRRTFPRTFRSSCDRTAATISTRGR